MCDKTRLYCVNQMETTQPKFLATRHAVCELAFRAPLLLYAAWPRPCQVPFRYQYYQQTGPVDHQLISCIPVFF